MEDSTLGFYFVMINNEEYNNYVNLKNQNTENYNKRFHWIYPYNLILLPLPYKSIYMPYLLDLSFEM